MSQKKQTEVLSDFEKKLLEGRKAVVNSQDDHNMQLIAEVKGVNYVSDSKSSTVEAMIQSLQGVEAPVILILGGHDKDNDYSAFSGLKVKKIKAVIYLGIKEEEDILQKNKNNSLLFVTAVNIEEAVKIGYWYGKQGDVVLYSPACACNAFDSYKTRGEEFKKIVKTLRA